MIIISSRHSFTQVQKSNRKLEAKEINLVDNRPANWTHLDHEQLVRSLAKKRVCLLVHGINNTFKDICSSYLIIETQLNSHKIKYDHIIGFIWPGGNSIVSFFGAKKRARELAKQNGTLLQSIFKSAASVDLIAHSLGAYLTLETIKKSGLKGIHNIYMMAPAIVDHQICRGEDLFTPTKKCAGLYVFRSEDDTVLRWTKPLIGPALGYKGPRDIEAVNENVRVVNCSGLTDPIRHNSYRGPRGTVLYFFTL